MSTTVNRLRELAETMTQAEAARKLHISRARVGQLARDHVIQFVEREVATAPVYCSRCRRRRHDGYADCLRCKWTPRAIRRLRRRYGLPLSVMSLNVLHMNIWTCSRWEAGTHRPNRISLVLLERLDAEQKEIPPGA